MKFRIKSQSLLKALKCSHRHGQYAIRERNVLRLLCVPMESESEIKWAGIYLCDLKHIEFQFCHLVHSKILYVLICGLESFHNLKSQIPKA